MQSKIETQQTTTVKVKGFRDRRGKPASVDGPPTWATDNTDLVTLEPSADGMSCKVTTGAVAGSAKVQMSADADPSSEVSLFLGTVDFVITQPQATEVELEVDTPTDIADTPPAPPA